ncbi:MAG: hypothetical protein ACOYU3_06115 [Bacillota bacterium]
MEQRGVVMGTLFALLIVCGVLIAYGAVSGDETLLLPGVVAAPVLLIVMLVYWKRSAQRKKMLKQDGHLIYWEYSDQEAEAIIARELPSIRKKSRAVAILLSVCFIVILLPFVLITLQADPGSPILVIAIPAALLPLLAIPLAPAAEAARIRRYPCITAIGRDYALIANRYAGINDYSRLKLEHAQLLQEKQEGMLWMRAHYSYRAGRVPSTIRKSVDIPVPGGRESEAEDFCRNRQAKSE